MQVKHLIEILQMYNQEREVYIHTFSGETALIQGYFTQGELDKFYLTDLKVEPNLLINNEI